MKLRPWCTPVYFRLIIRLSFLNPTTLKPKLFIRKLHARYRRFNCIELIECIAGRGTAPPRGTQSIDTQARIEFSCYALTLLKGLLQWWFAPLFGVYINWWELIHLIECSSKITIPTILATRINVIIADV